MSSKCTVYVTSIQPVLGGTKGGVTVHKPCRAAIADQFCPVFPFNRQQWYSARWTMDWMSFHVKGRKPSAPPKKLVFPWWWRALLASLGAALVWWR
jgi:hypothetical protein